MPLDRSSAQPQENGNSGRIKLVLRLDNKGKSPDAKVTSPVNTESRPKRSPHPKLSEESFYHGQKIPKKQNLVPDDQAIKEKEPPQEDLRPSRKRKSTMDSSDYVFDSIYSKKNGLEDEEDEEEAMETKKNKKKSHRSKDTEDWSVVTPPQDQDTSGFKLKLKLAKPPPPDTPDQYKKRVDGGSDKKKRRTNEDDDVDLEDTPSHNLRVTLKKNTPDKKVEITPPQTKRIKPEASPGGVTKKHSPLKKEEPIIEKRELREKPKPNLAPKVPLSAEEASTMKKHLGNILTQLIKLDKQQYFMDPVTEDIAPQYFTIITHPMDFKTMKKKLKDGKYDSIESLQDDFQLICNNCMIYNPPSTSYSREAKRMLNLGNRLLEKLHDVPAGTTLEHKQDDKKKEVDKTPTRQSTPSSTPNKATPNKPNSTPNSTPHHPLTRSATAPSTPSTPHNNSLGVSFPISSGQLSSMQHPISTTPQHAPYPLTPTGLRKPVPGLPSGYPPPPLNPNSPYSPRIGGHIPPAIPNTITRPPPLLPLQKSQSTNNMMPRPPLSSLVPSIPTPQRPPAPVGKPGARPPVVSMVENQATQTQAIYPEQPKRRYVKIPVEEPVKPPPPAVQDKTPAKLVAKIGTTPLVSPANVPGSFVYSMYIPKFESQNSLSTEISPPPSTSPSNNYLSNYVSVPSLHIPPSKADSSLSDDWLVPSTDRIEENEEVMEAIASDSFAAMDSDSCTQLLQFFEGIAINGLKADTLSFPSFASSNLLPRASLPVSLLQPIKPTHKLVLAPPPTLPPSASTTPVHATTITTTTTTTTSSTSPSSPTLPTPPSFLILDSDLSEQIEKLDSHEFTAQDLKELQAFQIDLSALSSLLPSSASPASPPSFVSSPPTTTTTTTTTTSSVSSPPLADSMEITPTQVASPTSPPTSPPVSSTSNTPVVVQPDSAKAKKMAQDILDKNLECLWGLQFMQHDRMNSNASEAELKLASQFLDGVFALGTAVPPSMLTTKEAVRVAIDSSGLVTGKRRNMRI